MEGKEHGHVLPWFQDTSPHHKDGPQHCMSTALTVGLWNSGNIQPFPQPQQAHAVLEIKGIAGRREEAADGGVPPPTPHEVGTAQQHDATAWLREAHGAARCRRGAYCRMPT